jgi:sulfur-oxidizing protein SoxY
MSDFLPVHFSFGFRMSGFTFKNNYITMSASVRQKSAHRQEGAASALLTTKEKDMHLAFRGASRRQVLATGSLALLSAALAPHLAMADEKAVNEELKKLYGDKKAEPGKIKLDVPQIAENGLVVPVGVDVESPMSATDYVKAVHIFADGNPLPQVVSYRFSPACGKASAATRMRLAQTQNVVCVAEMSDGKLYTAKAEVKVTIGGCGG